MSVSDLSKLGYLKRKKFADSTLRNWSKTKLIEYIRILEEDYDNAVVFNELQARNIERMPQGETSGGDSICNVITCKDCLYFDTTKFCRKHRNFFGRGDFCSYAERRPDDPDRM